MDEVPVAIVTGGTIGIGEACVQPLAGRGYRAVIADIDDPAGQRLACNRLSGEAPGGLGVRPQGRLRRRRGGAPARLVHCDVSRRFDVAQAVDRAMTGHGRRDVMANHAGIAPAGDNLSGLPGESFDRIIGVNLRGVFPCLRAAGSAMAGQGLGSIVSMASIGALPGLPGGFAYDGTKAGVVKMTIPRGDSPGGAQRAGEGGLPGGASHSDGRTVDRERTGPPPPRSAWSCACNPSRGLRATRGCR